MNNKKLEFLEVRILKMSESSGNEQFFVQLIRTDTKSSFINHLDYAAFQTKHMDKKECLDRAWFMASLAAKFAGLDSMDSVILENLNEDEKNILFNSTCLSII